VSTVHSTNSGIGARVTRKEDARHLAGVAQFVGDLKRPRQWEVAFVRSPVAHAVLRSVTVPPEHAGQVFTAKDLIGVKPIRAESSLPTYRASDFPALAQDKLRFVGECVALCIAPTRAEAEDIAESVQLQFEELPALTDALEARQPDAPRVHEEWDDNLFLTTTADGDIEAVAAHAPIVIKREYHTARQCMVPLEGKGVHAEWDKRNAQLIVHTSTQVPHLIRTGLSDCLGLDQSEVRVIAPDVGGGFGYKCVLQPEEISVSWAARHTGRPLRWTEDRREHLVAGANSRQHHYLITAYADEQGRLLALDAHITVDVGAYSVWPFTACLEAAQAGGNLPGPYALEVYRCKTYSVATNKPAFTPYRGVARPGVCFAMELTIDAIARAVGREPADVRAENLVPAAAMPYMNVTNKFYDTGDYPNAVRQAAQMIDLTAIRDRQNKPEPDGRRIGVGFSSFTEQTAHGTKVFGAWGLPLVPGYEQAMVKLNASGTVEVRSGNHSFGQGLETTLAQVASEMLSISIDRIAVKMGDTGETPYSTGAYASRGMVMAGGAVSKASETLAMRIRHHAAHLLQCSAQDVELDNGEARSGEASVSYADIARAWYLRPDQLPDDVDTLGLEVTEGYKPEVDSGVFTYATHAALVAVDIETGQVEILDYVMFEDCGTRVNPMILEGQSYGGAAQGIGTALFEESLYDDNGQPLTSTFADYVLPGAAELPRFRIDHMESPTPFTRHGVKGIGEGAAIAPSGAIVNAINDALKGMGVEINRIPATPYRVLSAILASEASQTEASA
jgi:aerobic carbon-monoxide dehydrogenase large subunit